MIWSCRVLYARPIELNYLGKESPNFNKFEVYLTNLQMLNADKCIDNLCPHCCPIPSETPKRGFKDPKIHKKFVFIPIKRKSYHKTSSKHHQMALKVERRHVYYIHEIAM